MPIPGFTNTSSISTGRTTTVSFWAYPGTVAARTSKTHQVAYSLIEHLWVGWLVNQLRRAATELHSGCKPYAKFHRIARFPIFSSVLEEGPVRGRNRSIHHPTLESGSRSRRG